MRELDCRKCKSWKGCPGQWYSDGEGNQQEWYSYGDICWCPHHVFWILKHSEDFDAGRWPKPPKLLECDSKAKTKLVTEAAFCKPKRIIGEVRARLKTCKDKGRILAEQTINREKMDYLDDDIKAVLYYISGWERRDMPFSKWQWQREERKMRIFYPQRC